MKHVIYNKPAENWNEAIPVGNGRLGAKIYGRPGHEIIKLNEESLWSNSFMDRANKSAQENIKEIKNLVHLQRESEAQELLFESLTSTPENMSRYVSAGELHIDFYDSEHYGLEGREVRRQNVFDSVNTYKRVLDLNSAVATTSFSTESKTPSTAYLSSNTIGSSIEYTREAFVSEDADVLIFRFSSSVPKGIYFRARLERKDVYKKFALSDDTIVMQDTHGVPFATVVMASASGGKVITRGDNLIVEGADDVVLYVDTETALRRKSYSSVSGRVGMKLSGYSNFCTDLALKKICFAAGTTFNSLKKKHVESYATLFNRNSFTLNAEEKGLSVEELTAGGKNNNGLSELLWNYSKYLTISSTEKPGVLPPLKNGIWCDTDENSVYSLIDNEMMNYLNDTFDFGGKKYCRKMLKRIYKNGTRVADSIYGCEGVVAHNVTDIWGDACPDGVDLRNSYKKFGMISISDAILDRYEYTQDKKFLKKCWKLLLGATVFFDQMLTLVDDGKHFSLSPTFEEGICEESLKVNAKIKKLYENTLKAAYYLNMNDMNSIVISLKLHIEKLKVSAEEEAGVYAEYENINVPFVNIYSEMTERIVSSKMNGNRVEIGILNSVPEEWKSGSVNSIALKGNLLADIAWEEGKLKSARVYKSVSKNSIADISVCFAGKKYDAKIENESIDVFNILPSTID